MRPSFAKFLSPRKRGRRECRVHAAPAVSCAKCARKTHTSIQVQTEHSGIPCAMALRLMPRSPRRRIRLVTVAAGLMARSKPGWVDVASASLTPATGARTTRFCRTHQHRSSCARCSLTVRPPCKHASRPTLPRPPHPVPTFVTMANAPLVGQDGGNYSSDLPDGESGIFLPLDRANRLEVVAENRAAAQSILARATLGLGANSQSSSAASGRGALPPATSFWKSAERRQQD